MDIVPAPIVRMTGYKWTGRKSYQQKTRILTKNSWNFSGQNRIKVQVVADTWQLMNEDMYSCCYRVVDKVINQINHPLITSSDWCVIQSSVEESHVYITNCITLSVKVIIWFCLLLQVPVMVIGPLGFTLNFSFFVFHRSQLRSQRSKFRLHLELDSQNI